MNYLLDTNSCIHLLANAFPQLTARVAEAEIGSIAVSSISFAEVAWGTHNGRPPASEVLDAFVEEFEILPFDERSARVYARLPFKRGNFDRLIGAHALCRDLTLITRNVRDFADLPGLRIEDWTR